MIFNLNRIWNGRITGLPMAALLAVSYALRRIGNMLSTTVWRGNLGSIGHKSIVQWGVTIRNPKGIHIGCGSQIVRGAELSTEIADARCEVGDGVIIGQGTRIDFTGGLTLKRNVVISRNAQLLTHSHGLSPKSMPHGTFLCVEEDVWIGTNAIIIEGVSCIGKGAVIAAGAVVTSSVPARALMAGIPARQIRSIGEQSNSIAKY